MNINSNWFGFPEAEFMFEGRRATVVFPEKANMGKNWTIKTEYKDAFPETEIALLKEGFHVAYLENKTRFATKEDCDAKARFVKFIAKELGLKEKCVPVGMSCGGAHAVRFAGYYPDLIDCMFIDAPVLNYCDFPAAYGNEYREKVWEEEFIVAYPGITRAKMLDFPHHPMNMVGTLIENKIPIIMLYGNEDTTVDFNKHGRLFADEYENHPELLKVHMREYQGHHPHGIPGNPQMIVDFILQHTN
ncbi:MAG: hypothetical protein IJD91_06480 [Clostridia bacterium]|nr:hypothetical protein [Clostridia bacterium]